ncbi:hypothetical protein HK102_001804 [Quaeritorhiza haematococci]|nr:hypothetical protein HK102_001804 [Quaeritorhiza haematococci]
MTASFIAALVLGLLATTGNPAAAQGDACLTTPTNAACADFTFPAATATTALSQLCSAKPVSNFPACEVFSKACNNGQASSPNPPCDPFKLLATLCTDEAVPADTPGCGQYRTLCGTGSVVKQCTGAPIASLPSARNATALVGGICFEMPQMKDCELCPTTASQPTGTLDCALMNAYARLCIDMPGMSQCVAWKAFCSSNSNIGAFCDATGTQTSSGGSTSTSSSPTPTKTSAATSDIQHRLSVLSAALFLIAVAFFQM